MQPYYEESGITIYHGDCREILPFLRRPDVIVTDPPYGINFVHGGGGGAKGPSSVFGGIRVHGDSEPFDPRMLLDKADTVILWGANHYAHLLPPSSGWLVWDKRDGIAQNDQADCEMAWSNQPVAARLKRHYWMGLVRASELREPRVHPTQKPIEIMGWSISQCGNGSQLICDPYMGSGTTLVAAKRRGLECIGIEIEEKYCEIAAKRLSQGVLAF